MRDSKYNKIFAQRLSYFLSLNHMSQRELARKLNVSASAVSDWLHAKKSPRMDKVDAMCEIFNCQRTDFLDDSQEKETSGYYVNQATLKTAQDIFENPNLKILFDAAKGSAPEDLKMAAELLKRLKGES